jgi:N-methylhydantoinase B
MTNTRNAPVEAIEIAYPLRVHRYGILRDSEGAGEWRGGVGIIREIEAVGHNATLGGRGDRVKIMPWGLEGGKEASGSKYYKKLRDGESVTLPSKFQGITLIPGERIVIETAGGGGWGDPNDRNPEDVKRDVVEGFITLERAREAYRVAIDTETLEVLQMQTRRLRSNISARDSYGDDLLQGVGAQR